jgi:hypothetical protein
MGHFLVMDEQALSQVLRSHLMGFAQQTTNKTGKSRFPLLPEQIQWRA